MLVKILIIILAVIVAFVTTILVDAALIFILPLFFLFSILFYSIRNLIRHRHNRSSKQSIAISSCGLATLLSISFISTNNNSNWLAYITFCLGFIGLIITFILFMPMRRK